MLVRIDNELALDMLMDRLEFWTDDIDVCRLYEQMYENYIEQGVFDGGEFDVKAIVDNDYVNWCIIIADGDEAYEDIKKLWDEEECCRDISLDDELNHGYSYIEAEYNGMFLLRI